eukprot:scaffold65_cov102-Cylindrotheca_fusiformis.AAC.2
MSDDTFHLTNCCRHGHLASCMPDGCGDLRYLNTATENVAFISSRCVHVVTKELALTPWLAYMFNSIDSTVSLRDSQAS